MKRVFTKMMSLLLPAAFVLGGCASAGDLPDRTENLQKTPESLSQEWAASFDFEVDPETFQLSFLVDGQTVPVSDGQEAFVVEDYKEENGTVSWSCPQEQIQVRLSQKEDYLEVQITSETDGDNTFTWPYIAAEQYYLPLGEGKRIPADDSDWINYLDQRQVSVMERLSMPFWITADGEYCVLFIMENPYRTEMNFSADAGLAFSVSHEYPKIDADKTNSYRIYLTKNDPVSGAKIYRNYMKEKGEFVTLQQKALQNPDIEKLYGAPFLYLWGELVISDDDINWNVFRRSLDSPVMEYLRSFAADMENGNEFESALDELQNQDYTAQYQKNVICGYISQVMQRHDFWKPEVFTESSRHLEELLKDGYEELTDSQKLQVHKHALAANMPDVFHDADSWMNSSTLELVDDMKENGIDHAWIGLNSWEQAYAKPELVRQAADAGYLIASYDSYHSIHEPGKEQWITARFADSALYDNATVTDKNGEKESGFQNVGRKLNPVLTLPSVKGRMEEIMANELPFNSWFIDCDATGEIYDDYTPEHITTMEQDLEARLNRMAYIRDQYGLVVGSEGGNDFSASTIAYAHGIELQSFSWMDEDMKSNRDSEYYIGKYYNPEGGVAEHFAKRVPVKEQYFSVFVDPRYDIPLFGLVYNDSVITTYHWDWSTFKIKGATQDRMVREVLYNVPPLYHLDREEWSGYKQDIVNHHKIWSAFSGRAIQEEMTGFAYLQEDGAVQKTTYGNDLTAVANFGDQPFAYEGEEIPPHSVWIGENGTHTIYTPSVEEEHE